MPREGKRRRRAAAASDETSLPLHYAEAFQTFCRMDTGFCVLHGRVRHIGLRTLARAAGGGATEEDVLRVVAAAPEVLELYWREAEADRGKGRADLFSVKLDVAGDDDAPCVQCRKGFGGSSAASQKRRRGAVLAALTARLASAQAAFVAANPPGARFDARTAPAVAPAEWPPRPKTAYCHLSGRLTARREGSVTPPMGVMTSPVGAAAAAGSAAARLATTSEVLGGVSGAAGPALGGAGPAIGATHAAHAQSSSSAAPAASATTSAGATAPVAAAAGFDPEAMLRELQSLPLYTGQVVHVERTAAAAAKHAAPERPLAPALASTLRDAGLSSFFTHQAKAIDAARRGESVMLCTSTSSGKSLVYNSAVIDDLVTRPGGVAMYVFPTKALAQDQLRALRDLIAYGHLGDDVRPATYDGDLSLTDRAAVRASANVLLTNPDTLHCSVLPRHGEWAAQLRALRYVVIDEAHAYRGLFGSHVACVLRRLDRVCRALGNGSVRFVCCSATLANPDEHARRLLPHRAAARVRVVTQDGSASGRRVFALWNPSRYGGGSKARVRPKAEPKAESPAPAGTSNGKAPASGPRSADACVVPTGGAAQGAASAAAAAAPSAGGDADQSGAAVSDDNVGGGGEGDRFSGSSAILETALLLSSLVQRGVRTLVFCSCRKLTELLLSYTRRDLKTHASWLVDKVVSYRAGYNKDARRELERKLFNGELLGVTATTALELGVDVGCLDCTVLLGFPGSISSVWQQAGRSGRNARDALTIMVLFNSPTDQYFAANPQALFADGVEQAEIDTDNEMALELHIVCAAAEVPLVAPEPGPVACGRGVSDGGLSDGGSADGVSSAAACVGEQPAERDYRALDEFGGTAERVALQLLHRKHLTRVTAPNGETLLVASPTLARDVVSAHSIRAIEHKSVRVLRESDKAVIDELPFSRAFFEVYPGAILLNQGTEYQITHLDEAALVAHAAPCSVAYYTKSRDHTDVQVFAPARELLPAGGGCALRLGQCTVHVQWYGFRKHSKRTSEIVSMHTLALPSAKYTTRALWVTIPQAGVLAVKRARLDMQAGIHAAQHALLRAVARFVRHDPRDISTEHAYPYQQRARPTHLVVYDASPGGTGVCAAAFDKGGWGLVAAAREMVFACECEDGCPGCVHDPRCSEHNEMLCKAAARLILDSIQHKVDGGDGDDAAAGEEGASGAPAAFATAAVAAGVSPSNEAAEADGDDPDMQEPGGYLRDEWAIRVARAARKRPASDDVAPSGD